MSVEPPDGCTVVLCAGAEGGSLTLYRRTLAGGEGAFHLEVELSFDDDGAHSESEQVATLDAAFSLLDATPGCDWCRLYALEVDPAYASEVLRAVETRLLASGPRSASVATLERWRAKCRVPTPE